VNTPQVGIWQFATKWIAYKCRQDTSLTVSFESFALYYLAYQGRENYHPELIVAKS
jgi:hypothetical protein